MIAFQDKIEIQQLAKGESTEFTTGKIDVVAAKGAYKLGPYFQPGLHAGWREELTGIVIETFAGNKLVDLFEYQEPTFELKTNLFSWVKSNGDGMKGYFLREQSGVLQIDPLGKQDLVLIATRDLNDKTRIWYERLKQRYRPDELPAAPKGTAGPRRQIYNPKVASVTSYTRRFHSSLPQRMTPSRHWTGRNGKSFRGRLHSEEVDTVHIYRESDKMVLKIAKANLSPTDLEWLEEITKPEPKVAAPELLAVDATGVNRSKIPILDQKKYGMKASDCLPNSYASFVLWWDMEDKILIPKGRDFEAKAQWIHRELSKRCGTTNNGGTSYRDAMKGLKSYFEVFHKDRYKMKLEVVYDISPASLSEYTKGLNATVLSVNTYMGNRIRRANAGYHAVTLIDVQPNGRIELSTWGSRLTGKMVPSKEEIPKNTPLPKDVAPVIYEIIFDEGCDFPSGFKKQNYRFLIDPSNYARLSVLSVHELKKQ